MLKRQRKVNISGSVSCISLLLLALLLVNPLIDSSASALESEENEVSPQATTISDVNISFSPTSGSASLTPVTEEGAKARTAVKANVSISNSGGYSVYLSSKTPGLIGKNSGEMIAGIDGSSTFDNLQTNTWGYAVTEEEELSEGALYKSMSQGQGDLLATGSERSVSYNFLLSFAAKIGNTKPADTYENEVTLSVVSSPLEITLVPVYNEFSIDYMQEMTSAICDNATVGTTGQLYDRRDNKPYWVTKLADGNCWMTQNLALDLSVNKDLTPEDSDVLGNWRPEFSTTTNLQQTGSIAAVYTGTHSWSQPGYVLNTPYEIRIGDGAIYTVDFPNTSATGLVGFGSRFAATDPGFYSKSSYLGLDGVTKCSKEADTAISAAASGTCAQYDAHYALGNYYQWNAATAGSGEDLIQNPSYSAPSSVTDLKNAASSVCPAGWQLPVGGRASNGNAFNQESSFGRLLQAYGWSNDTKDSNLLVKGPIFLTRSGNVYNNGGNLGVREIGKAGVYWTASSQQPGNTCPFNYSINGNGVVNATDSYGFAYSGASVRCVAR